MYNLVFAMTFAVPFTMPFEEPSANAGSGTPHARTPKPTVRAAPSVASQKALRKAL